MQKTGTLLAAQAGFFHDTHLHGIAGGGLVAHRPDLVRAGPDELDAMIVADVHERRVLGQETIALPGGIIKWLLVVSLQRWYISLLAPWRYQHAHRVDGVCATADGCSDDVGDVQV